MHITALFEPWVIGDGSYPPLAVGMQVNLSFEMDVRELENATEEESVRSIGDGEYSFTGSVLAIYDDETLVAALEANGLRFFIEGPRVETLRQGQRVAGNGSLVVDYYGWVEYVHEKKDPPNLFYNLVVRRIRRVSIPERFIRRDARSKSAPARVSPSDFGEVADLKTMEGQSFSDEFYLLDLETIDQDVARTFLG